MIHRFFLKHRLVIRMPAEVPPAVAKSFSVLLPGAAIITGAWVIRVLLEFNVNQFVQAIFSPLAVGLNTLPGMLLYTFLILLLWCLGIHGSNVMGSIGDPIFLALLAANTEAYTAGEPLPNIFAGGFYIMFLCYGGTGSTLGLIINMLVSKKKAYRSLGKMALPSAIFCINEPIIFGFPIVMNPIMMIPFILTPLYYVSERISCRSPMSLGESCSIHRGPHRPLSILTLQPAAISLLFFGVSLPY